MYLPKENKNLWPQKDLYKRVHSNLIHKIEKKWEVRRQMLINRRMKKSAVVCSHTMDLQLNKRKKQTPDTCRTWMNLKNFLLSKRNFAYKKRVHIVFFHLYETLQQADQIHGEKLRIEVVFEKQQVRAGRVHERISWSDSNVL